MQSALRPGTATRPATWPATQFYADVECRPEDPGVARALDELGYFTTSLQILGVYPADPFRRSNYGSGGI